jgi:hypothetical protein
MLIQHTPQNIVVFQRQNLRKAENFCRMKAGEWTIICAFDTPITEAERVPGIRYLELFAYYPYQPKLITQRVRGLIDLIYANTLLQGLSLNEALVVEGAPLLRAKDNEVMEYVLHRLVFVVDALVQLLETSEQRKIWVLTDCADRMTLPEWPTFERMLNLDAVYGPVFAQVAIASGIEVGFASVISQKRSSWMHLLRESALMIRRLASVLARGFSRRNRSSMLNGNCQRIAIWVRAKGQIHEVEPMVQRWLEEGRVLPFFMGDDSFKKRDCFDCLTARSDLPSVTLSAFLTPAIFLRALGLYLWFRIIGIRKLKFHPVTSHSGMTVDNIILSQAFRRELTKSLAESVFASSIVVREIIACHSNFPFSIMLVMSNYDVWGNLSAYVGKTRGFKTISIQNFNSDPWAYPTPCTLYDAHVCFDHLEREKLVQVGALPDKILALGSVMHSNLRDVVSQLPRRASARSRLSLDEDSIAILVGTQSAGANALSLNNHLLKLLFEVVAEDKRAVGMVKLHPYENISDYSKWIERAALESLQVQFLEDWNIEDAVNASDAYISRFSTTMLLGVMLRKPTLSFVHAFESVRARDSVEFIRLGIITSTADYGQARQWVRDLYSKEGLTKQVSLQEQLLAQHFSTYDENGEKRIRRLVEGFLTREASIDAGSLLDPEDLLRKGLG